MNFTDLGLGLLGLVSVSAMAFIVYYEMRQRYNKCFGWHYWVRPEEADQYKRECRRCGAQEEWGAYDAAWVRISRIDRRVDEIRETFGGLPVGPPPARVNPRPSSSTTVFVAATVSGRRPSAPKPEPTSRIRRFRSPRAILWEDRKRDRLIGEEI